jgi:hypothetical protein
MMAVNDWAQLYADSLVDVSDIAEDVGRAQDGYYNTARAVANDGNKWIAMPFAEPARAYHLRQAGRLEAPITGAIRERVSTWPL